MSTTVLFVELLVVGIQAFAWIALVIVGLSGPSPLDTLLSFGSDHQWLAIILFSVVGYTTGIVVDRAADVLFLVLAPKTLLLRVPFIARWADRSTSDVRMEVLAQEGTTTQFLEYFRSRVRVVRGTALNVGLLLLVALVTLGNPSASVVKLLGRTPAVVVLVGLGFLVVFLAVVQGVLEITYDARLEQARAQYESFGTNKGS